MPGKTLAREEHDEFRPHHGAVIYRMAKTYPTITLTVAEAIQNGVDAGAKKIFVGADVKGRVACVVDDGAGVSVEKFKRALATVGVSIKPKRGTLGQFGLGLVSPLNKCEEYIFASQVEGESEANIWTFRGEEIKEQYDAKVPRKSGPLPNLPRQFAVGAAKLGTSWRTLVHMKNVIEDSEIGILNLDELEDIVRYKFGPVMRDNGATVHVLFINEQDKVVERHIDPTDFTGEPLPVFTHTEPGCGKVTFTLYRARRTGGVRRGVVVLKSATETGSVLWDEFRTQAMGWRKLTHVQEAFDALGGGDFEGMVVAEKTKLGENRTTFERGKPLTDLYVAIQAWYLVCGKALHENEQETKREQRYQSLGEQSLKRMYKLLDDNPAFARKLAGVLAAETGQPKIAGPKRQSGPTKEGEPKTKERRVVVEPPKREGRAPTDAQPNISFSYAYEVLAGFTKLWQFDFATKVMTFNVLHPTWRKLDEVKGKHTPTTNKQIIHLQDWLTLKLLLLLSEHDDPDFDFEIARTAIDNEVKFYADLFILVPSKKGESDPSE